MATLGPGTRVYIGWCAVDRDAYVSETAALCRTGTILDGPFPRGTIRDDKRGLVLPATGWLVRIDDFEYAGDTYVSEHLLFPIDDGDDHAAPRTRDLPVDAESTA